MESKWPKQRWDQVVDRISQLVFRVYAGESAGTAFVISLGAQKHANRHGAILVTALHVLAQAALNKQELVLVSADKRKSFSSSIDEIRIQELGTGLHDTVMIMLLSKRRIVTQEELVPMLPSSSMLARGADIGWLGFPGFVEPELCFFMAMFLDISKSRQPI
jgi:hypothetical protein